MTKSETLAMIGDRIVEVDVARGSLLPNEPGRAELDQLRSDLDQRQRTLAAAIFDDNTAAFQQAAAGLKAVNDEVRGTVRRLEDLQETIANVRRFLTAVDSVVGAVGGA